MEYQNLKAWIRPEQSRSSQAWSEKDILQNLKGWRLIAYMLGL